MSQLDDRPDPDALLRRVQEEEAKAQRGRLKIFFGFAPGVGKTYRMLTVAHELVAQGVDLIVGIVEDHRRADTAALVKGLEQLPRQQLVHRERTLEEFNLDAALARRPRVVLVDELAHTNAPGARHRKRWQDVEELLKAGIDVLTTMNVQHVESLNDVVAQITGIQVRETVPDHVIDGAHAMELVDIAPEELLRRLEKGKVYLPEQARRAAEHFFQRGNLLALRELALRRTADHVDDDVRRYREAHGVTRTWAVGERILVCVGPAPSSAKLVRAAARMATGLRCPWVACYVESPLRDMGEQDRERIDAHLRVAESLGATIARLSGTRVSETLLQYARRNNVTRIIMGKPARSRLSEWLRGGPVHEVIRDSLDIDVHVIRGDEGEAPGEPREVGRTESASWRQYASAAVVVAAALGTALLLRAALNLPDLEMLFLLAVMGSAMWLGRGPSLMAAALGVACYDFFFVPPFYTFSVQDHHYMLTFSMMFGVGIVMSELTARLRRQEREAVGREERTAALYALTRDLAACVHTEDVGVEAARQASKVLDTHAWIMGAGAGEAATVWASASAPGLDEKELGVARWAMEHGAWAGRGTDTLPASSVLCVPLVGAKGCLGVLVLRRPEGARLRTDRRVFLEVFGRQVASALERARLAEEAKRASLQAEAEVVRSSLLSAVSHDLRTPLGSITGAATLLRDSSGLDGETRHELIDSIVNEAARLERLVGNLLDMTRLESGVLVLKREWVPIEEVVGSALGRVEGALVAHPVHVDIAPATPLVSVDPVLFEQVFVNLLENVTRHTPPGTPVDIRAWAAEDRLRIEVRDRGPGLAQGTEQRVFDKFFRGSPQQGPGSGLGLAICRGVVKAHGGQIHAENVPEGGACFRLWVPVGGAPPVVAAEGPT